MRRGLSRESIGASAPPTVIPAGAPRRRVVVLWDKRIGASAPIALATPDGVTVGGAEAPIAPRDSGRSHCGRGFSPIVLATPDGVTVGGAEAPIAPRDSGRSHCGRGFSPD